MATIALDTQELLALHAYGWRQQHLLPIIAFDTGYEGLVLCLIQDADGGSYERIGWFFLDKQTAHALLNKDALKLAEYLSCSDDSRHIITIL